MIFKIILTCFLNYECIWEIDLSSPKFKLHGKPYNSSIIAVISLKIIIIKEKNNYVFGTNLATLTS